MKVFVAGATGVLGTAAVPRLIAAGHEVSGLARTPGKAAALTAVGARPVTVEAGMDLGTDAAAPVHAPRQLIRAVSGHDVLVNLTTHIPVGFQAARRRAWRENDRLRSAGSRILLDAARHAAIPRFVQEAVGFAYADGGEAWLDENARLAPSAVTESSVTATEQALAFADGLHFAVVLRFGQLYGDDQLTRWQIARAKAGKAVVLGRPAGFVSPLHVGDAADAVLASLGAPSGVYNVAAEPVRRDEYAALLGAAAGRGEPARFVPGREQSLLGWRADTVGRSLRLSSEAYGRATGWRARTAVGEGWPG